MESKETGHTDNQPPKPDEQETSEATKKTSGKEFKPLQTKPKRHSSFSDVLPEEPRTPDLKPGKKKKTTQDIGSTEFWVSGFEYNIHHFFP